MDLIDLANHFKRARIEARLTQQEVARAAGINPFTVSKFERGALTEIGAVKLISLFRVVGLELQARPIGQARTLEDVAHELDQAAVSDVPPPRRVRHPHAATR
jgi:DNA-binding XRE family transcriptional regulator